MFDVPILEPEQSSNISLANAFVDIDDTPFAADINILANLGIISTQSAKFYPDNYLRHYDFVILFINALLTSQKQSLSAPAPTSFFADVDSSASYFSQLIYASDRGLIDHLVRSL
ncbi:MAG: S-layer homology domain-containing protein [bacterium]